MKKMRKNMCLLLAVLMMAGTLLIGCDEVPPEDVPTNETAPSGGNETPSPTQKPEEESAPDATQMTYEEALSCLAQGKTEEAYALFLSIPDYRDVSEHLERFVYRYGREVVHSQSGPALFEYRYNQYGQETERIEGSNVLRRIYDERGNCLRVIYASGSEERYTYDDKGNLVKAERYQASLDKVTYYDTYSYDEQGHVIERRSYDESDVLSTRDTLAYDEAGNCTEMVKFYGDYESYRYEYTYDESGNRISEKYTSGDTWCLSEYAYNAKQQMIRETYTSSWGEEVVYEYEYTNEHDDEGRLIKVTVVWDSELSCVRAYEYDENGNVIRYAQHEYASGEISYYTIHDYLDYQLYYDPFIGYVDPLADIDFGGK